MAYGSPPAQLAARLEYTFRKPSLLLLALTHRSHSNEIGGEDNQRLEFLGDAVLGLLAAMALLEQYPTWSEGRLSIARAALCKEPTLAARARQIHLGEYLILGNGEEKEGGRINDSVLADAYEAVLGAIYQDGGMEQVQPVFLRHFAPLLADESALRGTEDYKSELQKLLQKNGGPCPSYPDVKHEGLDHKRTFWVEVRHLGRSLAVGSGPSKKEAAQEAARKALLLLESGVSPDSPPAGEQ